MVCFLRLDRFAVLNNWVCCEGDMIEGDEVKCNLSIMYLFDYSCCLLFNTAGLAWAAALSMYIYYAKDAINSFFPLVVAAASLLRLLLLLLFDLSCELCSEAKADAGMWKISWLVGWAADCYWSFLRDFFVLDFFVLLVKGSMPYKKLIGLSLLDGLISLGFKPLFLWKSSLLDSVAIGLIYRVWS